MNYSLSQYVHDGFRLSQIRAEKAQIRAYSNVYEWTKTRLMEIATEELIIEERMFKFERHPNNR